MDRTARNRQVTYLCVIVALICGCVLISKNDWVGSDEIHTRLELMATLLSLIIGVIALVRYYSKKDSAILLLGAGFLGTTFLDGIHCALTSSLFDPFIPSAPPSLLPWSWYAPRCFLSLLMVASWLVWRRNTSGTKTSISEVRAFVFVGIVTVATMLFFSLVPLPRAQYPELYFSRPQEFLPAIAFLIALVGFYRKGHWKHDPFEHWLVISLILGFITQVLFMSRSRSLNDIMFDSAHVLKILSYGCLFVGLVTDMRRIFDNAWSNIAELNTANARLSNEIEKRTVVESHLLQVNGLQLKQTQELYRQRRALLSMMEDAEQAKQDAEEFAQRLDRANETLVTRNKELDEFTYIASHDLQEPLRKLQSFSKLLPMDLGGDLPEDAATDLKFITDAANRMENLVDDLLELSRSSRGETRLEPIELQTCLADAMNILSLRIEESESTITHSNLPRVLGDARLLTQLFQNLIGNGIKYKSPDRNAFVEVTAEATNDGHTITVSDNGIGIEDQYLDQIFSPFKRLHGRSEYEGSGIGLAICRKVVERHGGKIWAESNMSQGTSFKFTLRSAEKNSTDESELTEAHSYR